MRSFIYLTLIFSNSIIYSNVCQQVRTAFVHGLMNNEVNMVDSTKTTEKVSTSSIVLDLDKQKSSIEKEDIVDSDQFIEPLKITASRQSAQKSSSFLSNRNAQISAVPLIRLILDSSRTMRNFKERPSQWNFNYIFVDQQISQDSTNVIPYGKLLKTALLFTMPRETWKEKPKNYLQPILFSAYELEYKTFLAPNLFGYLQADL